MDILSNNLNFFFLEVECLLFDQLIIVVKQEGNFLIAKLFKIVSLVYLLRVIESFMVNNIFVAIKNIKRHVFTLGVRPY